MNSKPPNPNDNSSDTTAARKVIVLPEHDRSFVPTGAEWRGITRVGVPGDGDYIKKLELAPPKRGKPDPYKEGAGVHGAGRRQRLNEISERIRGNSHKRHEKTRLRRKSTQRPKPP